MSIYQKMNEKRKNRKRKRKRKRMINNDAKFV